MGRNREEIVVEILDICTTGAGITRIVYQANLTFRTVKPYLDLLIKNHLIEVKTGKPILYQTTAKGVKLIEAINQIDKSLAPVLPD